MEEDCRNINNNNNNINNLFSLFSSLISTFKQKGIWLICGGASRRVEGMA